MDLPPLWLLDVDGVLNAVPRRADTRPDRSVWPDWTQGRAEASGTAWPIWYSPTVIAYVREAHLSGRADVRWLTTWGDQANESLRRLLGLPELPVVANPPAALAGPAGQITAAGPTRAWWKLDAARSLMADNPGRRLIWTDDDLRYEKDACAWATRDLDCLLIAPRPQLGLTPRPLRDIDAFLGPIPGP